MGVSVSDYCVRFSSCDAISVRKLRSKSTETKQMQYYAEGAIRLSTRTHADSMCRNSAGFLLCWMEHHCFIFILPPVLSISPAWLALITRILNKRHSNLHKGDKMLLTWSKAEKRKSPSWRKLTAEKVCQIHFICPKAPVIL